MSEFDSRSVAIGAIRGAITALAFGLCVFGLVIGFVIRPVGVGLMILGIGLLVWSIASSWKDESALKWVNIAVKVFFVIASVLGLISLFTSPYI